MTIWFTSDTHFWHKNVMDYCNRPVSSKTREEMNEIIIRNWNVCVKQHDDVYHLGDFAFCGRTKAVDILNRLNGRKFLVRGNHDKELVKKPEIQGFFEWIKPLTNITVQIGLYRHKIVLCHFPILSWEGMSNGSWHLHGHCHGSLPVSKQKRLDVGIDNHPEFRPFSLEEVEEYMASKAFEPVDHHGRHE